VPAVPFVPNTPGSVIVPWVPNTPTQVPVITPWPGLGPDIWYGPTTCSIH
jgi:hypothetical protein